MVKRVVILKPIFASVIRRINVNQLHFAGIVLTQGVECQKVVALDDEIILARQARNIRYTLCSVMLKTCKCLRFGQAVNLVGSKYLVPKHLIPLCILFVVCPPSSTQSLYGHDKTASRLFAKNSSSSPVNPILFLKLV